MMKRLLFTSAIALFSVVSFAQNGNYGSQRSGGTMASQSGSYQRGSTTTPASSTQPVKQQTTASYAQNGNYSNTQQGSNNSYQNNGYSQSRGYEPTQQQPANNYNQGRDYGYNQTPQRQPEYGFEQHNGDHRYTPVFHQPPYRRDYRYEQHRGHDHFDAHGDYWY
jgi:hypothetical protein